MVELQTTKMHNAKLLSIASSSHSDTRHTARLEELLPSERTKNKSLQDRLNNPEKLSAKSGEYSYLSSLLTNTQRSNEELKKQPHLNIEKVRTRKCSNFWSLIKFKCFRIFRVPSSRRRLRLKDL